MQGRCALMNCRGVVSGLQLICEPCRQKRVTECRTMRINADARPQAHICRYGRHSGADRCQVCPKLGVPETMWCKPCDRCHYCGELHEVPEAARVA